MKIGLQIPVYTFDGGPASIRDTFGRILQQAEAAGFYSLWVMDHFFQLEGAIGPREMEMMESYTTLGYAAGLTRRIKLGTLVSGVTYRYPGILVKAATTLDVVSGGRAYFGVGAAWFEQEHISLGVPFPPLKTRFEMLEETLQIAHQMWSGEAKPFVGMHYQLGETLNSPNSIQRPHPPILIGGAGEEKTFRLIAKYGDACNIFTWRGIDYVKQKYEMLHERCAEVGRPYAEIEKTTLSELLVTRDGQMPADLPEYPFPDKKAISVSAAIEHFHQLAEAGTDHAILNMPNPEQPGVLELWATEIIPTVAKFATAGR